jgi:hypothetical protein
VRDAHRDAAQSIFRRKSDRRGGSGPPAWAGGVITLRLVGVV